MIGYEEDSSCQAHKSFVSLGDDIHCSTSPKIFSSEKE